VPPAANEAENPHTRRIGHAQAGPGLGGTAYIFAV